MIIGVPKELKSGEARVGITPDSANVVIKLGHQVILEKNAGILSGFSDSEYLQVGVKILDNYEQIWSHSDLLLKVKEPALEERKLFRKGQTIFSFLHPASDKHLVENLLSSKSIGISFDTLRDEKGLFPILTPMSLIAGQLSVYAGSFALQPINGGRGVLLGGDDFPSANVLIVGAGAAGTAAARTAIGVGANVCVLDINSTKIDYYNSLGEKVRGLVSNKENLEEELLTADLLIGAVYVASDLAPKLIHKNHLSSMRKGAAIVDICIDQGGFAETSRATSISNPTYIEQNIVHYCVPNMPAQVPRSSTIALNNAVMPWLLQILKNGSVKSIETNPAIKSGLVTYDGKLVNPTVAKALNLPHSEWQQ